MNLNELILCVLLIVCAILVIYHIFREKAEDDMEVTFERYSISYLCEETKRTFHEIVNMNMDALNLNQRDLENRRALKRSLSDAIRKCSQGNLGEKIVVITRIKSNLTNNLGISEDVIDAVIPFNRPDMLSAADMFEIMLYLEKRDGNRNMFRGICKKTGIGELKHDEGGYHYSITEQDIKAAYDKLHQPLSYDDKLNILTQRVYEETYGLSVTDLFIMEDDSLDGIQGGVSGSTSNDFRYQEEDVFYGSFHKPRTYESVWIIFGGKQIHLKFLSFQSNAVVMRICKNLAEHGRTGHITSSEGGLKTHLADGSRVTIFRPNNGSQWAFFVRKFTGTATNDLRDLIRNKGCEYPIRAIEWLIKGSVNLIYSGDQNSGKTTNMRASVRVIDKRQSVRSIEADFELYLNDAYLDSNILGTRPSERLDFPKLIELLKASDAHTILFGETASLEHAKHLIDLLLAGTKRIITTGHWPTPDELVSYFVHAMGGYGNTGTEDVEALVSRLLHIDIHCVKDNDGNRYIDRITEIIPFSREEELPAAEHTIEGRLELIVHFLKLMVRKKTYCTRDIIVFEHGEYRMINPISERLANIILRNLPPIDREDFMRFNKVPPKEVELSIEG